MTKFLSLIALNFFIILNAYSNNISIVSDLDDTLKITNSKNLSEAVRNALLSTKPYGEMPTLVSEMKAYTNELYVLTASPSLIRNSILNFLAVNQIDYRDLITRDFEDLGDKFKYKYDAVNMILKNSGDSLILIGDDNEVDQNVYAKVASEKPSKIKAVYIHLVTNRKLLPGVTGYLTSFDIAKAEYKAGRLTLESTLNIGEKIARTPLKKMKKFFPDFAYCPKNLRAINGYNTQLVNLTNTINAKINMYCRTRVIDEDDD